VAGDLRPGERVPQEEIAERIGVSHVPRHEAVAEQLVAELDAHRERALAVLERILPPPRP
jgi:hypothetical protein